MHSAAVTRCQVFSSVSRLVYLVFQKNLANYNSQKKTHSSLAVVANALLSKASSMGVTIPILVTQEAKKHSHWLINLSWNANARALATIGALS